MVSIRTGLGGLLVLLLSSAQAAVEDPTIGSQVTVHPTSHEKDFRVKVESGGLTHELRLHLSDNFVSQDFVIGLVNEDGSLTSKKHQPARCHYDGSVEGAEGSLAAISACDGVLEVTPLDKFRFNPLDP